MDKIETLPFDCVIVGAGPAGLTTAIRLAQKKPSLSIAVVEKSAMIGAHILSGAVFNPTVLDELIPNWQERQAPLKQPVTQEEWYYLTRQNKIPLPTLPEQRSEGCFVISLGELCQWLAQEAEQLGIHIFPGYAIESPFYNDDKSQVLGVRTQAMGLDKNGQPTDTFQPSVILSAKHTFIAEGAKGSTAEQLISQYNLRKDCDPQHYALGIKEKWRIQPDKHKPGLVIHTMGSPIPHHTHGGGFIYHGHNNELIIGLIVALNSPDPKTNPYQLLQAYKQHSLIAPHLESAECIGYGARAINEGGYQSIPTCHFPGGSLIGCSAGFVNLAEIKGIHHAMRSAILAADAFLEGKPNTLTQRIKQSPTGKALFKSRNLFPAFCWGRIPGLLYAGLDQWVFRGKAPWTLSVPKPDRKHIRKTKPNTLSQTANESSKSRLDSVALTNTYHREGQPCHLVVSNPDLFLESNLPDYGGPEQYYCPAGVYEYIEVDNKRRFQINSQNCIHCKSCSIRDPHANITWCVPEGGDGPNYSGM